MPDNASLLNILWWNVNRRLNTILLNVSPVTIFKPDIFFATEISFGYDAIPSIEEYQMFADKDVVQTNHGGIAVYVKVHLVPRVFDIILNTCYISFRLDFAPQFIFIGSYIQPENSKYFTVDMFCDLSSLLLSSQDKQSRPALPSQCKQSG